MKDNHLFVDEKHNILTGDEAKKKLSSRSDKRFLSEAKGITQVDKERWMMAQSYEKKYWLEKASNALQDRNSDHYREFDRFDCLTNRKFNHAIELGCGPFTNIRLMASGPIQIKTCSLEDPLIKEYLRHLHCSYDNNYLYLDKKEYRSIPLKIVRKIINPVSRNMSMRTTRSISHLLSQKLPVKQLIAKPIEDMDDNRKYDLIVMINVLEHCQNANKIFENILKMANDNAIFVFSDKYYKHEQIVNKVSNMAFEAGHPLLVDKTVIERFLELNFKTIFKKITRKDYVVHDFDWSHDSLYFVGSIK